MIDVHEIRIGNFLSFDFPNGSKLQYRSEHINNDFDGFKFCPTINAITLERISGIPISDSWLLKLGFRKIDRKFRHNWIIKCHRSENYYSIQFSENKYWLSNSEYDAWCYVIKDMEYVHQLQNLYFDLTGEEFIVNEDVPKMA